MYLGGMSEMNFVVHVQQIQQIVSPFLPGKVHTAKADGCATKKVSGDFLTRVLRGTSWRSFTFFW